MSDNLLNMMEALERETTQRSRDVVIRAPFAYPGGKSRSVPWLLKYIPYKPIYVSVFGGSGIDLIARHPVQLEVFNDRHAGITAFYRCIRDPKKLRALCDWLEYTIHSRDDFVECKNTWENAEDDVERAAKWYYSVVYSFTSLGRNWGRATSPKGRIAGKLRKKIEYLHDIHTRFRNVQIENQSWEDILADYDSVDTVFYLDPTYVDASQGIYKHELSKADHIRLIQTVFRLKGFVAISGYHNPLYDSHEWDRVESWEVLGTMESMVANEGNNKQVHSGKRSKLTEVLWIKEARI